MNEIRLCQGCKEPLDWDWEKEEWYFEYRGVQFHVSQDGFIMRCRKCAQRKLTVLFDCFCKKGFLNPDATVNWDTAGKILEEKFYIEKELDILISLKVLSPREEGNWLIEGGIPLSWHGQHFYFTKRRDVVAYAQHLPPGSWTRIQQVAEIITPINRDPET